jgi:hypothetical protein
VLILKTVEVVCFDTLLQVLILKGLELTINFSESFAFAGAQATLENDVVGNSGTADAGTAPEKKKREWDSRFQAQTFTMSRVLETLTNVKWNFREPGSTRSAVSDSAGSRRKYDAPEAGGWGGKFDGDEGTLAGGLRRPRDFRFDGFLCRGIFDGDLGSHGEGFPKND